MFPITPFPAINAGFAGMQMMMEAQAVIAYRLFGMAGLWSVASSENGRMVSEKGPAILAANTAAMQAMMRGKRPDEVYSAWVLPIGRKTAANVKRLSKRGPGRL